jgi:hypothetical protein
MKLEVGREDLKHEHRNIKCRQVDFKHLRSEVQEAVRAVGKATFYDTDRSNYSVVYPPEPPR